MLIYVLGVVSFFFVEFEKGTEDDTRLEPVLQRWALHLLVYFILVEVIDRKVLIIYFDW